MNYSYTQDPESTAQRRDQTWITPNNRGIDNNAGGRMYAEQGARE